MTPQHVQEEIHAITRHWRKHLGIVPKLAPKRRRPKRLAKKIAKRRGWKRCSRFAVHPTPEIHVVIS